jgi:hypothetical protein
MHCGQPIPADCHEISAFQIFPVLGRHFDLFFGWIEGLPGLICLLPAFSKSFTEGVGPKIVPYFANLIRKTSREKHENSIEPFSELSVFS